MLRFLCEQTSSINFNWAGFEMNGGRTRTRGVKGFNPQPLQSWQSRQDAVQHGYYMLYRMDYRDLLDGTMEDHTFSISMDVHVHSEYAAAPVAAHSNSSVRFSVFESPPGGLDLALPESNLWMVDYDAPHQKTLVGGNPDDEDSRRHNLMWGLDTNPFDGSLTGQCTRPVPALYIGVQCLQGFAFPASDCVVNPNSPPTLNDCSAYCPFTLTVRAMPRRLTAGTPVKALLAPGQWAVFELDVGAYDLLDVTINRPEFDNQTFKDETWKDGFTGWAWLSRGSCIRGANLTTIYHEGYCPHGGTLRIDPDTGLDVPPHRFCSRDLNYSFSLQLPPSAQYVRYATVKPPHGELDDVGYGRTQVQIAERFIALDESMHYPTQLRIRGEIAAMQSHLNGVSRANATWRRRWPMRSCTGAAQAGRYVLTVFADPAMDPRAHSGTFTIRFTNQAFDRSPLSDRTPRPGCLRRGGSESFELRTPGGFPELTSLGSAEVRSYHVNSSGNQVTTLTVRRGALPSASEYDARVSIPARLRVAMSACNVQQAQRWFFTVDLASNAAASEVYFELAVQLEDSTRALGESISGTVCCGQYKFYAFPQVGERLAPRVAINLTSGQLKAAYWRYGSCPQEAADVVDGVCTGWCVVDWFRIFSGNLGKARYRYASTLQVPYGMGEEPDKRRGGTWYLGLQALEGVEAQYDVTTAFQAPPLIGSEGCDRLDRYCQMANRFKDIMRSGSDPRAARCAVGSRATLLAALVALPLVLAQRGRRGRPCSVPRPMNAPPQR